MEIKKPKMILFDYGGTLLEGITPFDGAAGYAALLTYCKNPKGTTPEEMQALADAMLADCGIIYGYGHDNPVTEIHEFPFMRYILEYFGLETELSPSERERVFWEAANPVRPMPHIQELLEHLWQQGVRTGVVSNITFSGEGLKRQIDAMLPGNHFEFIIASSEYVFRKPHRRIFEIALKKAGLEPEDAWYCGDNVAYDVAGSSAVGMTPVWYTGQVRSRAQQPPECEHLHLEDWRELIELLQTL